MNIEKNQEEISQHRPIFIIGSGRSGTSILTGAMRSGGQIEGYLEGHFLPLILLFMQDIERYYFSKRSLLDDKRHMIADISQDYVEKQIAEFFRKTSESLATDKVWLDKSPDSAMIKAVPYIVKIWSQSRFIFAKRRGIENIISRLKKFPHVPFEKHCLMWKDCMESWLMIKDKMQYCSIEIEQREIALNPQKTAQTIGTFLDLDQAKVEKIAHIFTTQRPQNTGGKEELKAITITETGWTNEQINIFRKHCGLINNKFGYCESSSYYLQ
ncbi:sulfotransferase [Pleurocapsa sp. PCC 7319]|uniref:sulfotransferase n=1 Tax=Pleurocapsa sp. PCC 7319 TaxID=118161 RepID=UPI000348F259|nr:sulfotransferase [Pleurocapsa sp. PCC 7319]